MLLDSQSAIEALTAMVAAAASRIWAAASSTTAWEDRGALRSTGASAPAAPPAGPDDTPPTWA